jgi:NOL1/NOP2/fmu family ribosome biogenesis protein
MHPSAFPPYELDYESAIAYLRHESVVLSMEAPKGYLLLTYRGVPLGFVKNVGNRANNLYPAEWRIRSSHVPEVPVSL